MILNQPTIAPSPAASRCPGTVTASTASSAPGAAKPRSAVSRSTAPRSWAQRCHWEEPRALAKGLGEAGKIHKYKVGTHQLIVIMAFILQVLSVLGKSILLVKSSCPSRAGRPDARKPCVERSQHLPLRNLGMLVLYSDIRDLASGQLSFRRLEMRFQTKPSVSLSRCPQLQGARPALHVWHAQSSPGPP